eukprot:CAMPEP_0197595644 /NCGR_PEP_ID=MMETSP1326-20131121/23379_1 /TAXON_ID=1155430 /ORGANISM="Genus nov. species nov., Strain RCC2288" /LENGTH=140 /DNA_ID=CAMNT_0043162029 /DNA_START=85 /DNA_END=507 /DNA_ORIENTATION=+
MTPGEMPFMRMPHDTMRNGMPSVKADISFQGKHPVELIQEHGPSKAVQEKRAMLANLYGIAMPARMDIESQILSRQRRLPGLPSSRMGLEILTGEIDRFGFESYLDRPEDRPEGMRADLHSAMEARLGMNKLPGYGHANK